MAKKSTQASQRKPITQHVKRGFVRVVSGFRDTIGDARYPPQPNRYHLVVALNYLWCHQVSLARNVLGLQNSIAMDLAFPSRTNARKKLQLVRPNA